MSKFTNKVISQMVFEHSLTNDSKCQSAIKEINEFADRVTKMSNIFIMIFFSYVSQPSNKEKFHFVLKI